MLKNNINIKEIKTDLLIIGAGPGGYVAAIYGAKNGMDVTLVDKGQLGGTCLNVGCIPTKTLVESSKVCQAIYNGKEHGIEITGSISVNMEKIIERKDKVRQRLVSGIEFLMDKNKVRVISGEASFMDDKFVEVIGDETYRIEAKDVIIATGSKISKTNIPGADLPFVLNSTSALSSTKLPESITIIGGGVIGMEFAFIYSNFGVKVDVVEFMDRPLTMVDKDVSRELSRSARRSRIKVHTGAKVKKIESSSEGKAIITYKDKKGEHRIESEKILVAIGREPNIDNLRLERTNIVLNESGRGIRTDKRMKTNVANIYAIGDVTDRVQLAHVATQQGIVAVDNILNKNTKMDYSSIPNVIFTSPEIATVGIGEDEAKKEGLDIKVSKTPFSANGKALAMNESRGFTKLIKDNTTGKIIGASIVGPDASSLISTLTTIINNGLTEDHINSTIFPHPTTSEVIQEASQGLGKGAIHG